jgi:hypothetical protein
VRQSRDKTGTYILSEKRRGKGGQLLVRVTILSRLELCRHEDLFTELTSNVGRRRGFKTLTVVARGSVNP